MRTSTATRILSILAGALLVFAIPPALAQRAAIDNTSDPAAHSLSRLQPPTFHAAPAADDPWPAEYVVELEDLPDDAVPLTLVRVPDGWFMIGSPTTEQSHAESESPWHERLVVPPFYMSKYEITQAQWQTVMGYLPQGLFGDDIGPDYPVYAVSHNDAIAFIDRLATLTQEDLNLSLFGRERLMYYHLPSEALFEYSARAGEPTRFFFGDSLGCNDVAGDCATGSNVYPGNRSDYMWYIANDDPQWIGKQEVETKRPNAFGLYDMAGNVWEWVADWYHPSYYCFSPYSNPTRSGSGSFSVQRGGGWDSTWQHIRNAWSLSLGYHALTSIVYEEQEHE
jgi:formylglycine-generating enzyme required for sulfatase activity